MSARKHHETVFHRFSNPYHSQFDPSVETFGISEKKGNSLIIWTTLRSEMNFWQTLFMISRKVSTIVAVIILALSRISNAKRYLPKLVWYFNPLFNWSFNMNIWFIAKMVVEVRYIKYNYFTNIIILVGYYIVLLVYIVTYLLISIISFKSDFVFFMKKDSDAFKSQSAISI